MACLNLQTGLPEPYPRGWWAVVIDVSSTRHRLYTRVCGQLLRLLGQSYCAQFADG